MFNLKLITKKINRKIFISRSKKISLAFRKILKKPSIGIVDIGAGHRYLPILLNFDGVSKIAMVDPNKSLAMSNQKYLISGSSGILDIDQTNRGIIEITDANGVRSINPYFSHKYISLNNSITFSGYGIESIKDFLRDTYNVVYRSTSLAEANRHKATFDDCIIGMSILESAKLSLKSSKICNVL